MNRAFKKSRAEDGFTLIELLIVIVIIGVLAAIAIPVFTNQQNAAHDASVKSDARNTVIGVATALVTKPSATGFSVLAPSDTTAVVKLFRVPSVIVTVPAGAVAVRGVVTKSNWVTVQGTGADYVVHAQSTVDGFWYEFSSKTGKYTSSVKPAPTTADPNPSAPTPLVPSTPTPPPNSVQNPDGTPVRVTGDPVTTVGSGSGGSASGPIQTPPNGTAHLGLMMTEFPTSPISDIDQTSGNREPVNCQSSGGFSKGPAYYMSNIPAAGDGRSYSTVTVIACEPQHFPAYGDGPAIGFSTAAFSPADDRANVQPSDFGGGANSVVVCANTKWSQTADQFRVSRVSSSFGSSAGGRLAFNKIDSRPIAFTPQATRCPYIVSISFDIISWDFSTSSPILHNMTWSADQANSPRTYDAVNYYGPYFPAPNAG